MPRIQVDVGDTEGNRLTPHPHREGGASFVVSGLRRRRVPSIALIAIEYRGEPDHIEHAQNCANPRMVQVKCISSQDKYAEDRSKSEPLAE